MNPTSATPSAATASHAVVPNAGRHPVQEVTPRPSCRGRRGVGTFVPHSSCLHPALGAWLTVTTPITCTSPRRWQA